MRLSNHISHLKAKHRSRYGETKLRPLLTVVFFLSDLYYLHQQAANPKLCLTQRDLIQSAAYFL